MKKLISTFFLLLTILVSAQINNEKYIFTTSYGISWINFDGKIYALPPESNNNITSEVNSIGTIFSLEIDRNISKNNYIGIGFSRQHHSKKVSNDFVFGNNNLIYDQLQFNLNKNLIDIRFKKMYQYFSWSGGLFYFWENFSSPSVLSKDNGGLNIIQEMNYNNSDQFGVYASLAGFYPLKRNVKIGAQSKIYYSFAGIETISLSPFISFDF